MIAKYIRITIAEPTSIIRLGLEALLKKLTRYKVQIINLTEENKSDWENMINVAPSDLYILNPLMCSTSPRKLLPQIPSYAKTIALCYGTTVESLLREYDDIMHITDSQLHLGDILDRLLLTDDDLVELNPEAQTLTPREREIVVCIVKGMTNKDIANTLHLSTHTVITHRRNISKKLQIHSPSGLTIYAIMNKLVELNEINQKN